MYSIERGCCWRLNTVALGGNRIKQPKEMARYEKNERCGSSRKRRNSQA